MVRRRFRPPGKEQGAPHHENGDGGIPPPPPPFYDGVHLTLIQFMACSYYYCS